MSCVVLIESGRALPHSKTWPFSYAPFVPLAFWTAVLLHRFVV